MTITIGYLDQTYGSISVQGDQPVFTPTSPKHADKLQRIYRSHARSNEAPEQVLQSILDAPHSYTWVRKDQ